ncbi:MAG: hypothetical protein M3457_18890 [Chloroflexota bacterium]|nr:hypothetical protein [Chloroflexota bacterium]
MSNQHAPDMNRSSEERARNRPEQRVAAPMRSRHTIDGIGKRSPAKQRNSVVEANIDMVRETELIREGYGDRLGNNRWRINGRVYVREGTAKGTLYPESGPGVKVLTRNEYKALVLLIRYAGYTVEAEMELRNTPGMTDEVIAVARAWFGKRTQR